MSWDDPVGKHLDYFRLADPLASEQAMLRDCLCHRTGLDGHDELWFDVPWGREETAPPNRSRAAGTVPFAPRGSTRTSCLRPRGRRVAAATKSSWEDVVQKKRLLTPLGMTGANFSATLASKGPPTTPRPHAKDRTGKVVPVPWRSLDNIGPAGCINAGVADMAKVGALFSSATAPFEGKAPAVGRPVSRNAHPAHSSPPPPRKRRTNPCPINFLFYGPGAGWIQDYGPHKVVYHTGRHRRLQGPGLHGAQGQGGAASSLLIWNKPG